MTPLKTLLSATCFLLFAGLATADESASYNQLLTPVLSSGQTIIGQPIAYPTGTPKVTAAIVVVPPGKETGWHTHAIPLFAYILEGELSVDYGDKGIKIYKAGDGLLEAMNWPHNATNKGTTPVRILAVYMGAEGQTNAEPAAAPAAKPQ
jgi:quercetin dioxygenase-like cupin family protein